MPADCARSEFAAAVDNDAGGSLLDALASAESTAVVGDVRFVVDVDVAEVVAVCGKLAACRNTICLKRSHKKTTPGDDADLRSDPL